MSSSNSNDTRSKSELAIELEGKSAAHNYHPLPVVFASAKGINVTDLDGKQYMDFLSAYSAVNQGHCHPKIVKALVDQAQTLTLASRAFHTDVFGKYAEFVTQYFGYEMVLPMNTGAEAVETGIKLARKWFYAKKCKSSVEDKGMIIACTNNFHGRTLGVISMSTDPDARSGYGPLLPMVGPICPSTKKTVRYNHVEDLEAALEAHGKNVAAFLVEPIQGEAGIIVPDDGYLAACAALCEKHNVLFIADEIQTGLGRTGKMLCVDHDGVRPDILLLGKALSGGVYPVSAVLASREIMLCIKPGEHGSTYGGNPLGCAVSIAALEVLRDENMVEKSAVLGEKFRCALRGINSPLIQTIRGKGLLNALVVDESKSSKTALQICLLLKHRSLLAKPTHVNIIRLAPPLCITEEELMKGVAIIKGVLEDIVTMKDEDIPGYKADDSINIADD